MSDNESNIDEWEICKFYAGDYPAEEIGYMIWAWNDLQSKLCSLFVVATGMQHASEATAIWHSIISDKTQREMLLSLAKAKIKRHASTRTYGPQTHKKWQYIHSLHHINWLVQEIKLISPIRNDGVHSTMETAFPSIIEKISDITQAEAAINTATGSPKGERLKNKDIKKLFRAQANYALKLSQHCAAIYHLLLMIDDRKSSLETPARPDILQVQNPNKNNPSIAHI